MQSFIAKHSLSINSNELDKSLARLRIGYIIKKRDDTYSYRVPIFREWIMRSDIDNRLKGELTPQQSKKYRIRDKLSTNDKLNMS